MAKQFKITLKRSLISTTASQRETARCIGLRKTGSSAIVNDGPAMRGQIMKLQHLVEVSPADAKSAKGSK
jgi:large subunit ribosomal protein L30